MALNSEHSQSQKSWPAHVQACAGVAFEDHTASEKHPSPHNQYEGLQMPISRGPYARKIRNQSRNVLGNRDVAELVRETLKATYDGDACKHKAAARDANSSARAAENWFAADNPMSLTAFLNAYHSNPTFKAWARKILLMEQDHDPAFQAQLALFIQAAQRTTP